MKSVPDKVAFADDRTELTFKETCEGARAIGSALLRRGACREPVLIFMEKSPETVQAFLGTVYGGCYYVPVDEEMPTGRIQKLIAATKAGFLICDASTEETAARLAFEGRILRYDQLVREEADEKALARVRERAVDTDPVYVLFTSGSTGMPKGVIGHHRGVIDYIDQLTEILDIRGDCVFGNQAPLYFDASMKDIFPTLKVGATTRLIPKKLFATPVPLMEYVSAHRINTLCWVVSALTLVSSWGTFDTVIPTGVKRIAFVGEVFPTKQFMLWQEALPDTRFTNLYGPTEGSGVVCYYHIDHRMTPEERIPIGRAFPNADVFLLNDRNERCKCGEEGELCIRGSMVTHGYYRDEERTRAAFVQNPLNPDYPELIYRTGDMAVEREDGLLEFVSRRDFQIKHMGQRIELGDIESGVMDIPEVRECCCVYEKEEDKLLLFYMGDIERAELTADLRERLQRYMLPNFTLRLERLPLSPNGKKDRKKMLELYHEHKSKRRNVRRKNGNP